VEEYPLEIVDDHLVARIGDRNVLIDTGAPQSIGTGSLALLGEEYRLLPGWLGFDIPQLTRLVGTRIDALLGSDLLGRIRFLVDRPAGRVVFAREPLELRGTIVPVDALLGVPIVEFRIGERVARAFLDTGARLSYVGPEATSAGRPAGKATDYYPGFGEFTTEVFRIPIEIAGRVLEITCGTLPELLQMALRMAGTEWILGSELFRDGPVGFDMVDGRLVFG
jgi:hypothetical protein